MSHEEYAFGDALLLHERVGITLLDEGVKPTVCLAQLLEK